MLNLIVAAFSKHGENLMATITARNVIICPAVKKKVNCFLLRYVIIRINLFYCVTILNSQESRHLISLFFFLVLGSRREPRILENLD